jgi:hypothetical protein
MTTDQAIDSLLLQVDSNDWTKARKSELISALQMGSTANNSVEDGLEVINEVHGEEADDEVSELISALVGITVSGNELTSVIDEMLLLAPKDAVKKFLRWLKDIFS